MKPSFIILLLAGGVSGFCQQFSCATQNYVPASVRSEGLTELLGDMVVVCTGGMPAGAGVTIAAVEINVTLPASVTNRKNASDSFIDALLLVDEPHSVVNPNVPLLPCIDCTMTGTGNGQSVYNGSPGRFNVFQGELTAFNNIRFRVPFDQPGTGSTRTLRITNVRVNATSFAGATPNTISASIMIPGAAVNPATQILGVVHPGLRLSSSWVSLAGTISSCANGPAAKAIDPATDDYTPDFILHIEEASPGALRPRNIGQSQASGPSGLFAPFYSNNAKQDVAGYPYATETGLFAGSAIVPTPPVPQIGPSPQFAITRSLDKAGLATQGTRFYVKFTNTDALQLSLPVSLNFGPWRGPGAAAGRAVMVTSDTQGTFTPVAGDSKGRTVIPKVGSTATAIYEVVVSDIESIDMISIPVYAVQLAAPGSSQANVVASVGIGPTSNNIGPDPSAPIPRFAENSVSTTAFYVSSNACDVRDVTISLGTSSENNTGTLYVGVSNVPLSSPITVAVLFPSGIVATGITAPAPWVCTLQSLTCTLNELLPANSGRYFSVGFTVGESAAQVSTVTATVSGGGDQVPGNNTASVEIVKNYVPPRYVSVSTIPAGLLFSIDDTWYLTPATAKMGPASRVSALDRQFQYPGISREFQSWSDGGALTHSVTVPPAPENLGLIAKFTSSGSPMECAVDTGVSPLVRSDGKAEPLANVLIACSGGVATNPGTAVPKADIRIALSSTVTSRLFAPGFTETLLLVDDPTGSDNPQSPLLTCGAAGSGDNGSGVCSIIGAGSATYNGTSGHPNVFQGRLESGNTILFSQVPVDPPGPGKTRKFRITNLRANASLVPLSVTLVPSQIFASVEFVPASIASWTGSKNGTVGFILDSFTYQPIGSASLSQCQGANAQLAADPSKRFDGGPGDGYQAAVTIREGYPSSFLSKNWLTKSSNPVGTSAITYPPDGKQNVPDWIFNTETQFFSGPGAPYSSPPIASADFPAVRGLDRAGKADAGSRVYVKFAGVPAGVKLYVPSRIDITAGSPAGVAHLTSTNANGDGGFSPVAGNANGLAQVSISGGEGMIVYEVLNADAFTVEQIKVPVAAAFLPGQAGLGTIRIRTGMAPYIAAGLDAADGSSPVPRFAFRRALPVDQLITIVSCAQPDLALSMIRSGARSSTGNTTYTFTVSNAGPVATSGATSLSIQNSLGDPPLSLSGAGWACNSTSMVCSRQDSLAGNGAAYPPVVLQLAPVANQSTYYTINATVTGAGEINLGNNSASDTSPVARGSMGFWPLPTPCRVVDTRTGNSRPVSELSTRTFAFGGTCGVPDYDVRAYVLNVTVVPKSTLGYLTIWPAGQERPLVSTLNSLDGRIKANMAIVPAGANGAVSVFVTNETDVIIDVAGYFREFGGAFFSPLTPCRISDTRNPTGTYGGPSLTTATTRLIPMRSADPGHLAKCGVPASAYSYSLNATVVPHAPLGYLTLFNPDKPMPVVSTLNALTGTVTANAAIVYGSDDAIVYGSGRDGGAIGAFANGPTDLILDINGYFHYLSQPGGLRFYPVNPCRISDTRNTNGPFGGPALAIASERTFNIQASACGIPANAVAYSLNATIVPNGTFGYLTMWPTGSTRPVVSTLNAVDGAITSNAAIIPAGVGGAISVFGSNAGHLILDINGFFAP
jgi:hypothetical protein